MIDPMHALKVLQATPILGFPVLDEVAEAEDQDEFLCGLCVRVFASRGVCAMHRAKSHDVSTYAYLKQFVAGGVCPVCKTDFRVRPRVLQHLSRVSAPCRLSVDAGMVPILEPEFASATDAADREGRRLARKAGRHELSGLPCVKG